MTTAAPAIPTGTLKQVLLKDIKRSTERYRKDFTGLDTLVESIKEKGVLQPVTLAVDLSILAGERRIRAAELAGLEKIPALIRKTDGEIDAREIELIENTFRADFTWQERTNLLAEIDRLYKDKNIDWSGRKTAQLLNKSTTDVARTLEMAKAIEAIPELGQQSTFSDAYKMLKKFEETAITDELRRRQDEKLSAPEVLPGQPIKHGEFTPDLKMRLKIAETNYNICDAFEGLVELRSEGMIHIIECDPPYGIDLTKVRKGGKEAVDSTIHNYEEIPASTYQAFLNKLTAELYRVANRDAWLIFWFGPTWFTEVKNALITAKWQMSDVPAVWVKSQGQTMQPEMYLANCYEPFFLCHKGQPYMAKRGRSNVFQFSGVPSNVKYHPTERPLLLIEEILNTVGIPGQVVLVPFLGSGATLRAAYKQKMLGLGFDMNPEYKNKFMLAVEADFKEQTTTEAS